MKIHKENGTEGRILALYYEKGLNQTKIGTELNINQSTVSRYLKPFLSGEKVYERSIVSTQLNRQRVPGINMHRRCEMNGRACLKEECTGPREGEENYIKAPPLGSLTGNNRVGGYIPNSRS